MKIQITFKHSHIIQPIQPKNTITAKTAPTSGKANSVASIRVMTPQHTRPNRPKQRMVQARARHPRKNFIIREFQSFQKLRKYLRETLIQLHHPKELDLY